MWNYRSFQPFRSHRPGPSIHTIHSKSTPLFTVPVGVVGNQGPPTPPLSGFSKSPQIHKHDLENMIAHQPRRSQPLLLNSHFSSLPTGTTSLFLSLYTDIHSPPATAPTNPDAKDPSTGALGSPAPNHRRSLDGQAKSSRNPEIRPRFPPPRNLLDEYNQEEQKTAVSAGPIAVLQLVQSEALTLEWLFHQEKATLQEVGDPTVTAEPP